MRIREVYCKQSFQGDDYFLHLVVVFLFIADNEITRWDVLSFAKLLRVPLSHGKFINHEPTVNVASFVPLLVLNDATRRYLVAA